MCGIFFCLNRRSCEKSSSDNLELLNRRGPDYLCKREYNLDEQWCMQLYSTVLHMRGELCAQPLQHPSSTDLLMWNGEIFNGIDVPNEANDGQVLLDILSRCDSDLDVLDVFKSVQGPYAFVFVQMKKKVVWFGRDVFGRRSLTFNIDSVQERFFMSSVVLPQTSLTGDNTTWQELTAAGIYALQLTDNGYDIKCWPWTHNSMHPNTNLLATICQPLSLYCLKSLNLTIPSIDQIPRWSESDQPLIEASELFRTECDGLLEKLSLAVYRRVGQDSYFCHSCAQRKPCTESHISVMFSGGIDSMMLAYLAHKYVPIDQPIDLLNVAFQTGTSLNFDVPDRKTGRQALAELPSGRTWNFVEIDVTREELQTTRKNRISALIQPLESVLDDSIGCAMWFASRGAGHVRDSEGNTTPYTSTARVVLSGLGADEQLGGYSRHRSSFTEGGHKALLNELNMDVMRISARNLGRDDRVVADHSKEARFPFLDEEFVSYINELPVHKKMDLSLPRGVGEKLLLRACAIRCGLPLTAQLAKRAIQFGSRIAKCENRSEKGSDVCLRLTNGTK